jgi:cytosine/adenosine deaminase-related metal-dependent hydrolase
MNCTLRARWLFSVSHPPLERATLRIEGDSIVAVNLEERTDFDLGNVAILPGLVNAHTHLDLTGLRGLAPPSSDFTRWLRQVIAHRRSRTREQTRQDVQAGLSECLRFGTTLVGDISGDGASWDVLEGAPLRAVVFRELLGLTQERAQQALADADAWLQSHRATATCRPGLSPHAPYSARADLIGRSKGLAEKHNAPVAIHLAESAAEMELMRRRSGPLVPFLKELGVWDAEGLADSPAQVMRAASWRLRIPQLFIHGNYLARNAAVRPRDTVVYCPRTHAAFGHPPHPFREFLARKRRVALGTDSLASNPDLDLLAEARFLYRLHPDLAGDVLLRMATLSGAEALDWADQTGSLDAGKSADLIVLPLPDKDVADPHRLLFDSTLPVRAVMWRGRWLLDREAALAPPSEEVFP